MVRGETYHSTKWKQVPVLRQATNLEVTSTRYRNGIEKTTWRTHRYFIVELMLSFPRGVAFHNQ